MTDEKGPGEIYCRSCGEVIKRHAEICPGCGVRNEAAEEADGLRAQEYVYCRSCGDRIKSEAEICPGCGVRNPLATSGDARGGGTSDPAPDDGGTTARRGHDPSQYSTAVSENWKWAVAASVVLWLAGFALPAEGGLAGLAIVLGWGLMPIGIYFDRQWVRANSYWNPNLALWAGGALVPVISILVGAVYLIRRYDAEKSVGEDDPEDDALAELRRQYSQGEITEAQFEDRVERLLETEDRETARAFAGEDAGHTPTADEGTGHDSGTETERTTPEREPEN